MSLPLEALPEEVCRRLKAVPFGQKGSELLVALADPEALPELRLAALHRAVAPVMVPLWVVEELLAEAAWPVAPQWQSEFNQRLPAQVKLGAPLVPRPATGAEPEPIKRVVNLILSQAFNNDAEEIQIVPGAKSSTVYYRQDGWCQEVMSPPRFIHEEIIEQLKSMLQGESWLKFKTGHSLHCKFLDTVEGEMAVLEPSRRVKLDDLDLPDAFRRTLEQPGGLVLVEAPEGHGLRITFGAVLSHLERRFPVGVAAWSCGWTDTPVAFAARGQAELFRRLMRYDPAAVVIEEVTDGAEELARLASKRLVVAGMRPGAGTLPCLGKLQQRRERLECGYCAGRGCDRCRMTGKLGWVLVGRWQNEGETLEERVSAAGARGTPDSAGRR
ncbi:MAG: hypothetical protein AMXMBFR33_59220 [Candidatus Xenobia bacterium]